MLASIGLFLFVAVYFVVWVCLCESAWTIRKRINTAKDVFTLTGAILMTVLAVVLMLLVYFLFPALLWTVIISIAITAAACIGFVIAWD